MANKFKEKQILAEILNELYNHVDEQERHANLKYEPVGEEQAKDWRTGELQWEDEEHTIPKMSKKWEHIPKEECELSEEDKIRIKMCQFIKTQLEKMI